MPTFINPNTNLPEVWEAKPDGYLTVDEWQADRPKPAEVSYSVTEGIEKIEALIQKRLDDFSQTLTYGSILSACTYATSHNPVYALEGQYCVEARDATWDKAYEILNSMMAEIGTGEKTFTESELAALWVKVESQLPALKWPEGSRGA